jgi:anti-sigma factor RsiW
MTRKLHDIDLMQHADGELDDDGEREVDSALADDAVARDKLAAVGQLGELVRGHLELKAEAVADSRFAAMWREIDKAVAPASAATAAPAAPAAEERAGAWASVTRWLDRRLGYIITGVASAGAVVALVLVFHGGDTSMTAAGPAPIEPIPVVHRPAQIESLDAPGGTPTVLRLEDDDGDATVIWVTPDDVEGR